MDNYKHQDPDDDGQLPWQHDSVSDLTHGQKCSYDCSSLLLPPKGKGERIALTKDDAPSQPVRAGLRPFSGELSTRWERQKQAKAKWRQKKRDQAKEAGFRSAWEMRKTKHHAKHGYTPTASAEPATPLLDRLEAGNGPVRHIMRDGVRLID